MFTQYHIVKMFVFFVGQLISIIDNRGDAIAHGSMVDAEFDPDRLGQNLSEAQMAHAITGTR